MIQRVVLFFLIAGTSSAMSANAQTGSIGGGQGSIGSGQQEIVFQARLHGYNEVPAISTRATGEFEATLNAQTSAITYTLSYRNLDSPAQQAHIHLGQPGVNGGVSVSLCSNIATAATGTQPCPQSSGTVTGTIQASDVVGPQAQGIAPGELAELLTAMNVGATYVNVHSTAFPEGEIRGQLLEQSVAEGS